MEFPPVNAVVPLMPARPPGIPRLAHDKGRAVADYLTSMVADGEFISTDAKMPLRLSAQLHTH